VFCCNRIHSLYLNYGVIFTPFLEAREAQFHNIEVVGFNAHNGALAVRIYDDGAITPTGEVLDVVTIIDIYH